MRPLRCFRTARDLPCGRTATIHSKRIWSPSKYIANSGSDTLDSYNSDNSYCRICKIMAHGWCLSVLGTYWYIHNQTYQIYQELNQRPMTFTLDSYGFFPMVDADFPRKRMLQNSIRVKLRSRLMAGWIPSHFTQYWLFLDGYYITMIYDVCCMHTIGCRNPFCVRVWN